MRLFWGIIGGLVIGAMGALTYSRYYGEGRELAQTRVQLDVANVTLQKTEESSRQLKAESDSMSADLRQLTVKNETLKKQVIGLQTAAVPPLSLPVPSNAVNEMIRRASADRFQDKLALLKTRLQLTPAQEEAIKTAMDAEESRVDTAATRMLQGEGGTAVIPNSNLKSVDQTLETILTPEQKTAYEGLKDDEKKSQAETVATFEMNQASPLLQLSDTQKDQVATALYQNQLDILDPAWIKNHVSGTSFMAIMEAQAQAREDALAKILSPAQASAYHQQIQSKLTMQKAMIQSFAPASSP